MSERQGNSGPDKFAGAASNPEISPAEVDNHERHGAAWNSREFLQLAEEVRSNLAVSEIAKVHGRTERAITSACRRLLPAEQQAVDNDAAFATLSLYLRDDPPGILGNLPPRVTDGYRWRPKIATPPVEPSTAHDDSAPAADLDLDEETMELEPGDAAALSSEALSLLENRPREQKILRMRIGIDDDPHTFAEIGHHFGVTGARIQQIQKRALTLLVRQARKPGTPGSLLAKLLRIPGPDGFGEDFAERIANIASEEFDSPPDLSIRFLLCAAGVSSTTARDVASLAGRVARTRREEERKQHREESAQRSANKIAHRWIDHAEWPALSSTEGIHESFQALRLTEPGEAAGRFRSEKLDREVVFESGLERAVLTTLERSSEVVWYQEQPLAIPYVWQGYERRYYPDILAALRDGRHLLIEVKPLINMPASLNRAKADAGRNYAWERSWGWVTVDRNRTQRDLESHEIPCPSRRSIEAALTATGRLTWPQVKQLRSNYQIKMKDIAAFIIQTGAELLLDPHYCIYAADQRTSPKRRTTDR